MKENFFYEMAYGARNPKAKAILKSIFLRDGGTAYFLNYDNMMAIINKISDKVVAECGVTEVEIWDKFRIHGFNYVFYNLDEKRMLGLDIRCQRIPLSDYLVKE